MLKNKLVLALSIILLFAIHSHAQSGEVAFNKAITDDDKDVFYAYSGNSEKTGVLFIHGTPGSWTAFRGYLANPALQDDFFLVSVDRLGWGQSKIPNAQVNGDFLPQSNAIGVILKQYPNKKWVLVGHSLGASIAPQVALDYPDSVTGLLLLAGSLKPSLGKPRWYNYSANTLVVSSFLSRSMKNSNREIMNLKQQLQDMDGRIKQTKLDTDLIVMQGKRDKLVSPKNPTYVAEAWKDSFRTIEVIELEKSGHFLPWKQVGLVNELIYKLAQLHEDKQSEATVEFRL